VEPREPGAGADGSSPTSTPTSPPAPRKSALAFYGLLLVLFLPGVVAQSLHLALGLLWTQLFAFLLPALVVATGSNLEPRAFLRLGPVRPALIGLGFLAGLGAYLVAIGVMALAREVTPARWMETFDVSRVFEGPPAIRLAVAAVAALLAPVCEEVAFRGYLQSALSTRLRPAGAVAASTLLFAAIHLDPVRFPGLVVLGAAFGWLTVRAGSIWPAVAAHAANNALVSAFVLAGVAAPEEAPLPALGARLRGAAAALALGGALLVPVLRGFAAAARASPPPRGPVVLRDPALPSTRFSAGRVPAALHLAVIVGAFGLLALALMGGAGLLGTRR
jgi:membrane protease YdiL (CAAX protease family)